MPRRKPIRQINLRINDELRRKLEAAAHDRRISINQLMRQLLEDGFENENKAQSSEARMRNLEDRVHRLEKLHDRVRNLEDRVFIFKSAVQDQEEGGNTT
jgi:hypothetical protein